MGVRIFPETRDAKTAIPLNQQRRSKRLVRRQIRRRRKRRRELNEFLHSTGLLPKYGSKEWDSVMKMDPYELRRQGLTRKLKNFELGRAIYHLSKRRHFLGKDKASEAEFDREEEDKQTTEDREGLLAELKRTGLTLGEFLSNLDPEKRKRNLQASREAVVEEFNRLLDRQETHWKDSDLKLPEMRDALHSLIFHQKPVFWRKNTLGSCRFVPDGALCPRSSWLAQQRRMLEVLNNISIEGNQQPLDEEERKTIIQALQATNELTWVDVRKALKPLYERRSEPGFEKTIKFNLEVGGMSKIPGNALEKDLASTFGDAWTNHPYKQEIRESIHANLHACDYADINNQRIVILRSEARAQLVTKLREKYNISEEQALSLSELELGSGWEPFSVEATRTFLDMLEQGHRMGVLLNSPEFEEWRAKCFPNSIQESHQAHGRLPSPRDHEEQARLREIRNPTVVRTHNEMRKVVNNLLALHGRPDVIRVELARELRLSKKVRVQIDRDNRVREKLREQAKKDLQANHILLPSRDQIEKWLLWKECNHRCPYTGRHIGFDSLFGSSPSFEVEHIWPRSRCYDDSMANKALCLSSENRLKGNRTPYEYLHEDPDKWVELQKRLDDMRATKGGAGMSNAKIRRFLQNEIPDDFTNRQLVDTSYAAKEASAALSRLWSGEENQARTHVQTVSGRATAVMRHFWGMNGVLSGDGKKTRDDHRHHAIDALVVACIYPGITQLLANHWLDVERNRPRPLMSPWTNFRHDAERHISDLVVSHKIQRKVSGALHEETIYGKTLNVSPDGKYTQFVTRKPVDDLTPKERNAEPHLDREGEGIRDPAVRKALVQGRKADEQPKLVGQKEERGVRKVRILKKRNASLMREVTTGFVEVGENHHVAIYQDSNGKTVFETVSLFEAASRLRKRLPIVRKTRDDCTFLNSLSKGETIQISEGPYQGLWVVRQTRANGQVPLTLHHDANGASVWRPTVSSLVNNYKFKKVSIDPLGRIRTAND